ncbi:protein kinase [Toxoplasma gondii ARI]|uniref:Protein kinase n=1 Tax=Toxoplasma gondii ARI TaxID=1074872 RepID=A0A139XMN6_TOXGO|nr:protein kinase [Toxoplasma gondii ARI]
MASCCPVSSSLGLSLRHAQALDPSICACSGPKPLHSPSCSPSTAASSCALSSSLPFLLTPSLASTRSCSDAENSLEAAVLAAAGACGACGHAPPRTIQVFPAGTSIETLYRLGPVLSVCQAQQAKEQRDANRESGKDGESGARGQKRPEDGARSEERTHQRAGDRRGGEGSGKQDGKAPSSTRPVLRHAFTRGTHQPKIIKSIDKQRIPASAGGDRLWRRLCMRLLNLPAHRNVLSLDAIYEEKQKFYFVSEKLEGGELFDFLLTEKTVEEHICQYIIFQILQALNHMHSNHLLHRDIKPENLMFRRRRGAAPPTDGSQPVPSAGFSPGSGEHPSESECGDSSSTGASCFASDCSFFSCADSVSAFQGNVGQHRGAPRSALTAVELEHELVLIDFDTCKMMEVTPQEYGEIEGGQRRLVGTYGYLAPEVLRGGEYSVQSDLWSVGVILYILMTGIPPLPMELLTSARASLMVFSQIQEKQGGIDYDVFPLPDFPLARDLCQKLLQINPRHRMPSAREALRHPWLRDFTLRFGDGSPTAVPPPMPSLKPCGCNGAFGEAMSLPFGFPTSAFSRGANARSRPTLVSGGLPQESPRCMQATPLSVVGLPGAWRGGNVAGASQVPGYSSGVPPYRFEGEEGWWAAKGEQRNPAPRTCGSGSCGSESCSQSRCRQAAASGFCQAAPQACSYKAPSPIALAAPGGLRPAAPVSSPPSYPSSSHSCFFPPTETPGASASSRSTYTVESVGAFASCPPPLLSPPRVQNGDSTTPTSEGAPAAEELSTLGDVEGGLFSNDRVGLTTRQNPQGAGNCLVWFGTPGEAAGPPGGSDARQEATRHAVHAEGVGASAFAPPGSGSDPRSGDGRIGAVFTQVGSSPLFGLSSSSPAQACNIPAASHAVAAAGEPCGTSSRNVSASLANFVDLFGRPLPGGDRGREHTDPVTHDRLFEAEKGDPRDAVGFAFGHADPGAAMLSHAAPTGPLSDEQMMDADGSNASSHRGVPTSETRSRSLSAERERQKDARVGAKAADADQHRGENLPVFPGKDQAVHVARSLEKAFCADSEERQDACMETPELETNVMQCGTPAPYRTVAVTGCIGQSLSTTAPAVKGSKTLPLPCPSWTPTFHIGSCGAFVTPMLEERRESCGSSTTPSTACTRSTRDLFHPRQTDSPQGAGPSVCGHCICVGNGRDGQEGRTDSALVHTKAVAEGACKGNPLHAVGASRRETRGRGPVPSPNNFSGNLFLDSPRGRRKRVASPECFRASAGALPTVSVETVGAVTPPAFSGANSGHSACDAATFAQDFAPSRDFSAPEVAEENVPQTPLISSPSLYPSTRPFFASPQTNGVSCVSPVSTATTVSSLSQVTGLSTGAGRMASAVPSLVLPPQSSDHPQNLGSQASVPGRPKNEQRTGVSRPAGLQPLQQQHLHGYELPASFSLPAGGPHDLVIDAPLSSPPSSGRAGCTRAGKRRSLMHACSKKGTKESGGVASGRTSPVSESPSHTLQVSRSQGSDCLHAQLHGASSLSPSSCGSNTTRASGGRHNLCVATGQSSFASSFVASSPCSPAGASACNPGQINLLDSITERPNVADLCFQATCRYPGDSRFEGRVGSGTLEGLAGGLNSDDHFGNGEELFANGNGSMESSEHEVGTAFDKAQRFDLGVQMGQGNRGMVYSTVPVADAQLCLKPFNDLKAVENSFALRPPMSCTGDRGRYVQGGYLPADGVGGEIGDDHEDFIPGAGGHPAVTVVDTLQALLKAAEDVFSMGTAAGDSL